MKAYISLGSKQVLMTSLNHYYYFRLSSQIYCIWKLIVWTIHIIIKVLEISKDYKDFD